MFISADGRFTTHSGHRLCRKADIRMSQNNPEYSIIESHRLRAVAATAGL
jgi:hypothetical protein